MPRIRCRLLTVCCLVLVSCAEADPTAVGPRRETADPQGVVEISADYHPYAAMTEILRALAARAGEAATLKSLATTVGEREVWLLTIAAGKDVPAEQRQALLLVGGIDADHPASSEVALRVASRLLRARADEADGPITQMLENRTVHVIPRANPDGIETYFDNVKHAGRVNARPVDDDRDGLLNEDGPNDLNGDGLVMVMRVGDPAGQWMIDPDEPRLMKQADASKGERGVYKLVLEGVDDDGDGSVNEDGPGGVDDDRNWPHFYEPGIAEAGRHQLSEPEARALAELVVAHPHVTAAIVYGRHDNLVNVPTGEQRGPTGRDYRDLHPDDVKLYEYVGEHFRQLTELEGSDGCRPEGAFYAWLYSHRGIPTFATNLWWPIAEAKPPPATRPTTQPTSQPRSAPSDRTPGTAESDEVHVEVSGDDIPPEIRQQFERRLRERFPERRGHDRARRAVIRKRAKPGPGARADRAEESREPAADASETLAARVAASATLKHWLKYSDEQRAGAGFIEWTTYDHPTLGQVEIGGLVPYFTTTPPAAELDEIASRQVRFLTQVSEWLPDLRFGPHAVKDAGGGVWQVEVRLVNDGYLPTHIGIARHAQLPPIIVRPLVEPERLLGGKPLERIENLAGSGGSATLRWLIRGAAGDAIEFHATHCAYGELRTAVVLSETAPASGVDVGEKE